MIAGHQEKSRKAKNDTAALLGHFSDQKPPIAENYRLKNFSKFVKSDAVVEPGLAGHQGKTLPGNKTPFSFPMIPVWLEESPATCTSCKMDSE